MQSPKFLCKVPKFLCKVPKFLCEVPKFHPSFCVRHPRFCVRCPSFCVRRPSFCVRHPSFCVRRPSFCVRCPSFTQISVLLCPNICVRHPNFCVNVWGKVVRQLTKFDLHSLLKMENHQGPKSQRPWTQHPQNVPCTTQRCLCLILLWSVSRLACSSKKDKKV